MESSSKSKVSGSDDSADNRWDPDILNKFECKQIFTDDAEEHLPDIFDVDKVVKQKGEECKLCQEPFNMLKRKMHHCRSCGLCVCDLCSQTSRRLSKLDKKEH